MQLLVEHELEAVAVRQASDLVPHLGRFEIAFDCNALCDRFLELAAAADAVGHQSDEAADEHCRCEMIESRKRQRQCHGNRREHAELHFEEDEECDQ